MVVRFVVGDLLTGRRIQTVPALTGRWSDVLNRAGEVACTISLKDPVVRRLGLAESATPWKAFLAAIDGDTVLQAGPIIAHSFNGDSEHLTLTAAGLWAYFDRRTLLPAGTTDPTDAAAGTSLTTSLQGVARFYVEQALSWAAGDIPVVLPDEIAGDNVRDVAGANLAWVGSRLSDLTSVENGPDIRFSARLTTDMLGIEWTMLIGTPTQPQLYSALDVVFNVGVEKSSVSNLSVEVSGARMASQAWAVGGRSSNQLLISRAESSTLIDAGYPLLEAVDTTHSTATEVDTIAGYATELVTRGGAPIKSVSFDHDLSQRPFLSAFNVGDFASVRIRNNAYLPNETIRMRITSRAGKAESTKVQIVLQPEGS